jgi:mRNA interferase MazF
MTSYSSSEIVLIAFPYTAGTETVNRPALVILDTGDADIVVARVTTQPHYTAYDVPITDWSSAGLLAPSWVRLHKLAALEKSLVNRRLGSLPPTDYQQVSVVMRRIYGTW